MSFMASLWCVSIVTPIGRKEEWGTSIVLCNSKALVMFQIFPNLERYKATLCKILISIGFWLYKNHACIGMERVHWNEERWATHKPSLHWGWECPWDTPRYYSLWFGVANFLSIFFCPSYWNRTLTKGPTSCPSPIPPLDCRVSSTADWIPSSGPCLEKEKKNLSLSSDTLCTFLVNLPKLPS